MSKWLITPNHGRVPRQQGNTRTPEQAQRLERTKAKLIARTRRPWQLTHGFASLGEAIEMKIADGYQSALSISIWYNAECNNPYASTERQVKNQRAVQRRLGYITYDRKHGWRTHPDYRD